jgi:hypothetical protein
MEYGTVCKHVCEMDIVCIIHELSIYSREIPINPSPKPLLAPMNECSTILLTCE